MRFITASAFVRKSPKRRFLHRLHKARVAGKQHDVAGRPLPMRLVVTRLIDEDGYVVPQRTLLCNVWPDEVSAKWIAYWYGWRWHIESFFKLINGEVGRRPDEGT